MKIIFARNRFLFALMTIGFFLIFFTALMPLVFAQSNESACISDPVTFTNVEKKLLPLPSLCRRYTGINSCGRPGTCVTPDKIIMHTTWGTLTAQATYDYFATGSEGRGVGSHFTIGKDGKIIQMVEMGTSRVEYAQAVGGYQQHISIEMAHSSDYKSKSDMPKAQYDATVGLVRELMGRYNIPIGSFEYDKLHPTDSGIYSHYQMSPEIRTDPGRGWMRDFREELKVLGPGKGPGSTTSTGTGQSASDASCVVTKVGSPSGSRPNC